MIDTLDLDDLAKRAAEEGKELGDLKGLAVNIAHKVFRQLVATGILELDGKSPAEIFEEFRKVLDGFPEDSSFWDFAIDYTAALLREARRYRDSGESLLACLMYATWLEHWVNALITDWGPRKGIGEAERIAIIRESKFSAKMGWLLRVLGLPDMELAHRNAALEIVNHRNSFVHHKYKAYDPAAEAKLEALVARFDNTVKYLENYYIRNLLTGLQHIPGRWGRLEAQEDEESNQ